MARDCMTMREAAQRGGETVRDVYGHRFFEENGRLGGRAVINTYGVCFYEEIGKKGVKVQAEMVADGRAALGDTATYKECLNYGRKLRRELAQELDIKDRTLVEEVESTGRAILGKGTREQCLRVGIAVMKERGQLAQTKSGDMTVREAGRKGGETCAERHGYEFYEENGRKGGLKVLEYYGPGFYEAIGDIGRKKQKEIMAAGRRALGLPAK